MKTYSHVRRQALDRAASTLEPTFRFPQPEDLEQPISSDTTVAAQVTSQSDEEPTLNGFLSNEIGSSGWTRTSNPPVNSRMLCH